MVTGLFTANFEIPIDSDTDNLYNVEIVAADGFGRTSTLVVVLEITDLVEIPMAGADSFTVNEAATYNSVVGELLSNDSDPDGLALTVSLVSGPAHGSLTLGADGTFIYAHDGGETTVDSFDYRATNPNGISTIGTVGITINPIQDATVVADDVATTTPGVAVSISPSDLLANDFDVDSTSLMVMPVVGSESAGTVSVDGSGILTFLPDSGFIGTASFSYIVVADGESSAPGTVLIDVAAVTPTPPPPVPVPVPSEPDEDLDEILIVPPSAVTQATDLKPVEIPKPVATPHFFTASFGATEPASYEGTDPSHAFETSFFYPSTAMREPMDAANDYNHRFLNLDFATTAGWLWSDLDEMSNRMSAAGSLASFWSVATPSLTTTISVGYAIWVIKGGQIMAGLMAQVPAWQLISIDPLPILRSIDEREEDVEGDSLASMVDDAKTDINAPEFGSVPSSNARTDNDVAPSCVAASSAWD